jgi:transposase
LTTKLHVAVDALGNPIRIILTPGQDSDIGQADALIHDLPAENVIADKAYDANALRAELETRGIAAVIPSKANRLTPIPHDRDIYKERHVVECFFCKIKDFRRIATRYEKTARNFLAMAHFAASIIWLR